MLPSLQSIILCFQQVVKIGADYHNMSREGTDWKLCVLFAVYILGCSLLCILSKHLWCIPGLFCFLGSELCLFYLPKPMRFRKLCLYIQLLGNSLQVKKCLEGKRSILLASLCMLSLPIGVKLDALVSLQCLQTGVLYIFSSVSSCFPEGGFISSKLFCHYYKQNSF